VVLRAVMYQDCQLFQFATPSFTASRLLTQQLDLCMASRQAMKSVHVIINETNLIAHLTHPCLQVKSRQIWGDMYYTADSDLVAVLMHLGYYNSTQGHAPAALVEAHAILRLTKPRPSYPSKHRYLKSRMWNGPTSTCSYTVSGQEAHCL
jgi:hypothetical protein